MAEKSVSSCTSVIALYRICSHRSALDSGALWGHQFLGLQARDADRSAVPESHGGGEGLHALRCPWPPSLRDEDRLSIVALAISFCRHGQTPGAGPYSRLAPKSSQGHAAESGALAPEWQRP